MTLGQARRTAAIFSSRARSEMTHSFKPERPCVLAWRFARRLTFEDKNNFRR